MDWKQAKTWRDELKKANKKLVFTNGCFDILHAGHVAYLTEAKQSGDALILGLNSDDSVKRLGKSPNRPLQSETGRALVLAGLAAVDAIVVFDQDTPLELIQYLVPDVLIKGADYKIENIVGAKEVLENGGSVQTIDFLEGYSTTSIEKKILLSAK